mgnify:FL=1
MKKLILIISVISTSCSGLIVDGVNTVEVIEFNHVPIDKGKYKITTSNHTTIVTDKKYNIGDTIKLK